MHPHSRRLRDKIAKGEPVLGTFITEFTMPAAVNVMADVGFDFLTLDGEHGNFTAREVEQALDTGWQAGLCMLVRVPNHDRAIITRSLDAGAGGIVVPAIDSMEQVHRIVRATKYTPVGKRGVHLFRGHTRHRPTDPGQFMAEANRDTLTLIQIELVGALELVDQIAATEGVDGLYVGRGDLSVDMGLPGQWNAPQLIEAVEKVIAACRKHGKIVACHTDDVEDMANLRDKGVQLFGYFCDIGLYKTAGQGFVDRAGQVLNIESAAS